MITSHDFSTTEGTLVIDIGVGGPGIVVVVYIAITSIVVSSAALVRFVDAIITIITGACIIAPFLGAVPS
jgi:hypothetical protein